MKKILVLLFLAALTYGLILVTPIGFFFYSLSSLNLSEETLSQELAALATLIVFEEPEKSDTTTSQNQVTFTVSQEGVSDMLFTALSARQYPCLTLKLVEMLIAPEMISLTVSWQCEVFGYQLYKASVFSEWFIRLSRARIVEIQPDNIHTNHLYSVNWADFWKYVTKTKTSDGWLALSPTAQMHIQELMLQDNKISFTVGMSEE